ncbi:hypothetical protein Taro_019170, partial [Colocasia esculenta]|nr:hypothetical protein [Colocasia esculenta]
MTVKQEYTHCGESKNRKFGVFMQNARTRHNLVRVATGFRQNATGSCTDRDDKPCRDQIATEGTVAMALVNAAYRAVAFTGSVPESDRESTMHWIADLTYPILTQ